MNVLSKLGLHLQRNPLIRKYFSWHRFKKTKRIIIRRKDLIFKEMDNTAETVNMVRWLDEQINYYSIQKGIIGKKRIAHVLNNQNLLKKKFGQSSLFIGLGPDHYPLIEDDWKRLRNHQQKVEAAALFKSFIDKNGFCPIGFILVDITDSAYSDFEKIADTLNFIAEEKPLPKVRDLNQSTLLVEEFGYYPLFWKSIVRDDPNSRGEPLFYTVLKVLFGYIYDRENNQVKGSLIAYVRNPLKKLFLSQKSADQIWGQPIRKFHICVKDKRDPSATSLYGDPYYALRVIPK